MGLYDNYKLYNSTAIPTFNGSEIDEIKNTNAMLGKAYAGKQGIYDEVYKDLKKSKTGFSTAPHSALDEKGWNEFNNRTQAELKAIVDKGDLENQRTNVDSVVERATPIMMGYMNNAKNIQAAQEELGSKEYDLSNERQSQLMSKWQDDYSSKGGIQFDPMTGNVVNGTGFTKGGIAKNVDKVKLIKDAVAILSGHEGKQVRETNGLYETSKDGYSWKKLEPWELKQATVLAKSMNPHWTAYDNQTIELNEHHTFKNATDKKVLDTIMSMPDTKKDAKGNIIPIDDGDVKNIVLKAAQQGKSPLKVYKEIWRNVENNKIAEQENAYASMGAYNNFDETHERGVGPVAIHEAIRKSDEKATPIVVMPSTLKAIGEQKTYDEVSNDISKNDTDVNAIKTKNADVQYNEQGNPITNKQGNYLDKQGNPISNQDVIAELDNLVALNYSNNNLKSAKTNAENIVNKELGYKQEKVWNDINNTIQQTKLNEFKVYSTTAQIPNALKSLNKEQLVKGLKDKTITTDGNYLYLPGNKGFYMNVPSDIDLSSNLDLIKNHTNRVKAIWKKEANASNNSLNATYPTATPIQKATVNDIGNSINDNKYSLTNIVDQDGNRLEKKDYENLDFTKIQGVNYTALQGNNGIAKVTLPPDANGKSKSYELFIPSGSNLRELFHNVSASDNTPLGIEFHTLTGNGIHNQVIGQMAGQKTKYYLNNGNFSGFETEKDNNGGWKIRVYDNQKGTNDVLDDNGKPTGQKYYYLADKHNSKKDFATTHPAELTDELNHQTDGK